MLKKLQPGKPNIDESKGYTYSIRDGIAVIELGEKVLGGAEAMEFTEIIHNLHVSSPKAVVINMGKVSLINSSGLGMLVSALSTLRKQDIPLLIANPSSKVKELMEMTHLDKVLRMNDSIEEAINSI